MFKFKPRRIEERAEQKIARDKKLKEQHDQVLKKCSLLTFKLCFLVKSKGYRGDNILDLIFYFLDTTSVKNFHGHILYNNEVVSQGYFYTQDKTKIVNVTDTYKEFFEVKFLFNDLEEGRFLHTRTNNLYNNMFQIKELYKNGNLIDYKELF